MIKHGIMTLIILFFSIQAWAEARDILVVGLFSNQAVIEVDGKQHFLKVGQSTPDGIKLISANSQEAILEVDGAQQSFPLGSRVSTNFSAPTEKPTVSLWPTNGMYRTTGVVNGFSVDFLVDTGAFTVALNGATARRLGLDFYRGERIPITTASGYDMGYKITLDSIQIEGIKLYNVAGVVIDGPEPRVALLGMSFLGQLDIRHSGDKMELRQKY
jgi:aspartyl protease family protein